MRREKYSIHTPETTHVNVIGKASVSCFATQHSYNLGAKVIRERIRGTLAGYAIHAKTQVLQSVSTLCANVHELADITEAKQ